MFNRRTTTSGATFEGTQRDLVAAYEAGFHGNSYRVNPLSPATMQVTVEPGLGWFNDSSTATDIGGVQGVNDLIKFKPLWNPSRITIPVPAADTLLPRIDIVEVRAEHTSGDPTSRDVLNPTTGIFAPGTVNKTLSFTSELSVNGSEGVNYKTGIPSAVPVAPSPDTGCWKIAEIYVGAGVTTITNARVADMRTLLLPGNSAVITVYCIGAGFPLVNIQAPPGFNVSAAGSVNTVGFVITGGDMQRMLVVPHLTQNVGGPNTWNLGSNGPVTLTVATIPVLQFLLPQQTLGPNQVVWSIQETCTAASWLGTPMFASFNITRNW